MTRSRTLHDLYFGYLEKVPVVIAPQCIHVFETAYAEGGTRGSHDMQNR